MNRKSMVNILIKVVVAVALIAYLVRQGHLDGEVLVQLWSPGFIVTALLLSGLILFLQGWRWHQLLRGRGFPTSLAESEGLFLIGTFFNYALPGAIGGDVVKAYYVAKEYPQRRMEAVLSVAVDRIIGLYVIAAMGACAALVKWSFVMGHASLRVVSFMAVGLFLFMTLFLLTSFSRRLTQRLGVKKILSVLPMGARLTRAYQAIQDYAQNKRVLFTSLILSVVAQSLSVAFMMLVGRQLGIEVGYDVYFFAVPLGFIAASIPIAPAGVGVGQVAFLFLFQLYTGSQTPLGQTAITAFQLALLAWGLVGAVLYLRRGMNWREVTS